MNSLPLMTDIIRPGELSTIVFFEVRPVADFMNTMYWHDTLDKSLISLGSVKISRVYHCTYAGFIKRKDTNEMSITHYDGAFVAHDQIITVVEFVAQIGMKGDRKEEDASLTGTAWPSAASTFLSLKKDAAVFSWKEQRCKTCAEYSGAKYSTLKSSICATCDEDGSNWSSSLVASKTAARPEPENIDEKKLSGNCKTCNIPAAFVVRHRALIPLGFSDNVIPRECRECGADFMNWTPK